MSSKSGYFSQAVLTFFLVGNKREKAELAQKLFNFLTKPTSSLFNLSAMKKTTYLSINQNQITMKTVKKMIFAGLVALLLPTLFKAQTPWVLQGNNNATATSFLGTTNAFPLRLGTSSSQHVQFFTNNAERMRLTSTGLLGIGTTSPLYRLHLVNSTHSRSGYFTNTFASASSTFGLYTETSNTGTGSEAAGFFKAQGAAGTNLGLDTDARNGAANYGIRSTVVGTSTASSQNYGLYSSLTPSTSASNFGVYSTIVGSTANPATNHFSGYFNNGKVYVGYRLGIGVASPLAALHVTGAENDGTAGSVRITSGTGASAQNMLFDGNEIDALFDGLFLNNNSNQKVVIADGGGMVGIDISDPTAKLHVNGNLRLQDPVSNNTFMIETGDDGDLHFIGDEGIAMTVTDESSRVGVRTSNPVSALDVRGNLTVGNEGDNSQITMNAANGKSARIGVQDDDNTGFFIITDDTYRFRVNQNGSISVGSTNTPSGYKMSVDGKLICEELRVELSGAWGDYVFANDYELLPLEEVGNFITENKHLPGIPTAAQIEAEGIAVGEMQTKMMVKIEELTLYLLQLKKENDELRQVIESLKD